jgi:hypothetical protein
MKNEKNEFITDVTGYTITWTANEPTAGTTATVADGTVPTVAELGQGLQDVTTILNALIAKVNS